MVPGRYQSTSVVSVHPSPPLHPRVPEKKNYLAILTSDVLTKVAAEISKVAPETIASALGVRQERRADFFSISAHHNKENTPPR